MPRSSSASFARLVALVLCAAAAAAAERLLVFAGAASKPATEEAARRFTARTGIAVDLSFGGSGQALAQMRLSRRGDVYFPGSSDFMELAKRQGAVRPETERIIAYLVPAIAVRCGNPHGVRSLDDLARQGLRVAIADPRTVCLGGVAVEIFERVLDERQQAALRRNLVNYTESCEKTATAISLGMVDAVIGWSVFGSWDPERIEIVRLPPEQVPRIGYLTAAVSAYSCQVEAAQGFIDFLAGSEGQAVFAAHGYFSDAAAACAWLGAERPVGGEYQVPASWLR